jgi:hypothetical protein
MPVAVVSRAEKRVKKRKKVVKSKLSFAADEEDYNGEDGNDAPEGDKDEDEEGERLPYSKPLRGY